MGEDSDLAYDHDLDAHPKLFANQDLKFKCSNGVVACLLYIFSQNSHIQFVRSLIGGPGLMLSGGPSGGGAGMIVEESSYHQADIKKPSTPAAPQASSGMDSPFGWWQYFCHDYHRLHPSTAAVFQRLSAGVEHFRTEDYRKDPFLLRIWLAYLSFYSDVYGDEEEVRRLYKYVRSEHIGGDNNVELHLHYAHFELRAGKSEKCATILEAANKIPTLTSADSLRRATVEFKLLGSFRLDPIIEQQPQQYAQTLEELVLTKQPTKDTTDVSQLPQEHLNNIAVTTLPPPPKFMPPPTPSAQELAPGSLVKMTPVPMNGKNFSLPSPIDEFAAKGAAIPEPMALLPSSGIKATEEQRAALSHRIRRLGLGPPKRAVVTSVTSLAGGPPSTGISITHDSPNDSTVPRTTPRSLLPMVHVGEQETDSPLNSPTKSNPNIAAMAIDQDNCDENDEENLNPINNMSMTTISPIHHTTTTLSRVKKKSQSLQTEAIGEETVHNVSSGPAAISSSTTHGTATKFKAVKINGQGYKILALIGKGGSSRVYKVLANDNTIYAMKKVNLRHLDESTIQGYLNEIDLLESFRSESAPHIIRLIDHEVAPGDQLLMLMEYGEADLSKLLRSKRAASSGGIDANFVRYMWQQMLRAVQTVHAAKIVHCDLKPANFLLVGGTLKLIDFGISKAIMNDTTNIVRENQVGTVNYMSPEALQESNSPVEEPRGRIKIGRASDVWSLGCILYEMVYGRPPFAAFSLIQRLHKILDPAYEIDFPPLSPALSDPFLLPVIQGCLLRNSKRRFTLEQLLTHPFLVPQASAPTLGSDAAVVTRQQLEELIGMFAKRIPSLDVPALTDRILSQWQQQRPP